jgi:hypothetical protein
LKRARFAPLAALLVACGCGSKPAQPAETSGAASEPASKQPEPEAAAAEPQAAPEGAAEKPAAEGDAPPRTVKYIMTTKGLEIEIEGVRFMPRASPVKSGKGWGVRVEVDAKVLDDAAHSLLDPENGPLAFAGTVERGGPAQRIVDKRTGEGEKLIAQGDKVAFSREWPGKSGEKPLVAGQTLTLEVGLWGLGPDADQRRPVRDFFQVKLRVGDSGKPQPVITPPPSANP